MASDWNQTTVGQFCPFKYGKGLPERERNAAGHVPVYGSNGVVGFHEAGLVEGPVIVIGRKGTVGAVHFSTGSCWPIDTTFFIEDDEAARDIRFTYYLLKTLGLEHMNADSAVPGLNRDAAHAREVQIPPLPEQRAIASTLGAQDEKIELNRRMNETLEAIARAIFKSWFVDFDPVRAKAEGRQPYGMDAETATLFPDAFEDSPLGKIPHGWEVVNLSDLVEFSYGKALKASERRPGPVPVHGSNGRVGWHDERLVEGPGIVIGRKGNPGVVTWVSTDFFPIDTTFFVVPRQAKQNWHYLYFALQELDLPSLNADSAVPGLNRNIAYMSNLLSPPPDVLQAFDDIRSSVVARMHENDQESRILGELRDRLLPELLSGSVRVDGPSEQ